MRYFLLLPLALAGCARPTDSSGSRPRSLNDCLLVATQKSSADGILAAERLCREVFSTGGSASHGLGHALYYLAGTGKCLSAEVHADGSVEGGFGLCSQQARFERDASGSLLFTCVLPTTGEPPAVYKVNESTEPLALHSVRTPPSGLPSDWTVSRTLAACSLATTEEDRSLANQLADHAEPEWLDAPLAIWKNGSGVRPRRAPGSRN